MCRVERVIFSRKNGSRAIASYASDSRASDIETIDFLYGVVTQVESNATRHHQTSATHS